MADERSVETVRGWYATAHEQVLSLVEEVDEPTLTRQPIPGELPVAWHLWHLARHAETFAFLITGEDQLWHTERLAESWRFTAEQMGPGETGNDVEQHDALSMPWPSRDELIAYVVRAFNRAIDATSQITADTWTTKLVDDEHAIPGVDMSGGSLLTQLTWHCGEHHGSIEATLGVIRAAAATAA